MIRNVDEMNRKFAFRKSLDHASPEEQAPFTEVADSEHGRIDFGTPTSCPCAINKDNIGLVIALGRRNISVTSGGKPATARAIEQSAE